MRIVISPDSTFSDAAERWIELRTFTGNRGHYVSPRTLKDDAQYVKSLGTFFERLTLKEIHVGNIMEYQRARATGELSGNEVGPNRINQEVQTLVRILKRAGCWTAELEEMYQPLQREESDIPRALTPAEQERFLQVASSQQKWELVYWYSILALHTTCHSQEMRRLKLGDLNLFEGLLYVRSGSAKNKYRIRTIPLTDEAKWAAHQIAARAHSLGATSPQQCLFPFRVKRNLFDPDRPMTESGIKKPFDEIRKAAGVPYLDIHGLRHSAITRLAEAGTPIPVIMSMAGHISPRMTQHYTQISEQAKRAALAAAYGRQGFKPRSDRFSTYMTNFTQKMLH